MKKFGFTLAEILITLSIIAIAAATLAPSYLKSRPDKYKFKVVKCYNMIVDANERLLDNPFVYASPYLSYYNEPDSSTGFTSYSSSTNHHLCKYPLLMGELLNLETVSNCDAGKYKGRAADATQWEFQHLSNGYEIAVTFPRSGTESCSYDAATCKYPNIFKFKVDNYGDVFAADDDLLTKAFLKNIYNIHKNEDYEAINN